MVDFPPRSVFERLCSDKQLPSRSEFDRLLDKKRALIVLKKPTPEGRDAVVSLAKKHGIRPEREVKYKHWPLPHAPTTLRIQQDVTISIDGLPIDPDGRVVVKQELAFDLRKPFPSGARSELIVTQTDRLIWLRGQQAFERASEVVKCLDPDFAAVSQAWRLPGAIKRPQRFALDPVAADLRIPKLPDRPELLKKLERFGKLDRRPQFGGDWYEFLFREAPQDFYKFAERFYAELGFEIELAYRGITLLMPLATAPPTDSLYEFQTASLNPIRAVEMWGAVNTAPAALAALANVKIFALDIGVFTGDDAPLNGLSTSAHGVPGPVLPGGSVLPLGGVADPNHGTKMVGIMAARWTGPALGSGIAGIAGCCHPTVSVTSVTSVGLVEIAKSIDYAVACLAPGGGAPGHKGVILIGHDVLRMSLDYVICGCLEDKAKFDTALLNAEAHDIVVVVPAGNYFGGPVGELDIPNVLPPGTTSTLIVGASGNPATGGAFARWNDVMGASKIDNGAGTGGPSLIAPGANIYAVLNATVPAYSPVWGTSCAAAHVAGVAALMRAIKPAMPAAEVKTRLLNSARPLGFPQTQVGRGLLDGFNALQAAMAYPGPWP